MNLLKKLRRHSYQKHCEKLPIPKEIGFLLLKLFVVIALSCTSISCSPVYKQYLLEIEEGKQVMVLLRVKLELDGEPVEAFRGPNFRIKMGGFKTGGKLEYYRRENPDLIFFRQETNFMYCFSKETCKQGWIYFFLEPGITYISFSYATLLPNLYENSKNPPIWRMDITNKVKSIYIGTLNLKGIGLVKGGIPDKVNFSEIKIINEADLANAIMNEFYPSLGPPLYLEMPKHSGPLYLIPPS